uniref:Rho-GAP domain-containing protein n=1 Tax=Coturnix japonica TaxID=93934 RepID=A0A8C2TR94_COTJA
KPLQSIETPLRCAVCVTEVETRGLAEAGLYRVPGAEPLVREWKRRMLHGGESPSGVSDIHVVCGVLKDFLRGLKEPLVTFSLHAAFLQAADIPDEAACSTALQHLVGKLPAANRDTLAFLMLHLLRLVLSQPLWVALAVLVQVEAAGIDSRAGGGKAEDCYCLSGASRTEESLNSVPAIPPPHPPGSVWASASPTSGTTYSKLLLHQPQPLPS